MLTRAVSGTVLFAAVALCACGGVVDSERNVPSIIHSLRIEPHEPVMTPGTTTQLRAVLDADPGVDTSVVWSSEPSESGALLANGRLSTCWPPGVIRVKVASVAFPHLRDSIDAFVASSPVDIGVLKAIGPAGWQIGTPLPRPIDVDSLTGDIDLLYFVSAQALACRAVDHVYVRVTSASVDTLITVGVQPFTDAREVRVPFRTTMVANGRYTVVGTIGVTGLTQRVGFQSAIIVIKNP